MAAKKNAAAHDLRTPKYRLRVVKNLKKAYLRRPKHPARAAESFLPYFTRYSAICTAFSAAPLSS